nr:hypothetical protein [Tanacetum cinerariifolium]
MVYFSAIPRDGIFEIDFFDSYTNVSSIYALSNKRAKLNFDFAFLWHYRLGHISKKHIEKLQHDGLLNSTDLRDFKICVPCMSRKMERKPYTHQVEREKDLLGLINTDVYGTFMIMSRKEARYFITFTDDFSRYGYVYLFKHKHELFETFKVFQKEVENQLGKTIKLLRSDCEGEYMSQEFLDHLKDHEIIAHCTPPYMPQYNGVSERRNRTLLDMNAKFLENSLITQEASRSLEDLEINKEEDTYPFIATSLHHKEDDLEIDEPQSDIIPIIRFTRTWHAPDRMCLYIDVEEHELGDLGEPTNYKAALLDPESDKWLNTKGFTQTYEVNYKKTFSPMAIIRAIRILIAIAAYYDYEIWQMDVKTAFLNEHLSEEVYMEQPKDDLYWTIVKNILKNLRNTKDMFLVYGGAVDWKSTKQSNFATSSAEAEYIAAYDASKEAIWVRKYIYVLVLFPQLKNL